MPEHKEKEYFCPTDYKFLFFYFCDILIVVSGFIDGVNRSAPVDLSLSLLHNISTADLEGIQDQD